MAKGKDSRFDRSRFDRLRDDRFKDTRPGYTGDPFRDNPFFNDNAPGGRWSTEPPRPGYKDYRADRFKRKP